jgi:hypothetical protein
LGGPLSGVSSLGFRAREGVIERDKTERGRPITCVASILHLLRLLLCASPFIVCLLARVFSGELDWCGPHCSLRGRCGALSPLYLHLYPSRLCLGASYTIPYTAPTCLAFTFPLVCAPPSHPAITNTLLICVLLFFGYRHPDALRNLSHDAGLLARVARGATVVALCGARCAARAARARGRVRVRPCVPHARGCRGQSEWATRAFGRL